MRKLTHIPAVLGISVLSIGVTACSIDVSGESIVKREEKRFTVTGQADVNLRTFDGSIQLKSWDRDEVLVEIERRGPDEHASTAKDPVGLTDTGVRVGEMFQDLGADDAVG